MFHVPESLSRGVAEQIRLFLGPPSQLAELRSKFTGLEARTEFVPYTTEIDVKVVGPGLSIVPISGETHTLQPQGLAESAWYVTGPEIGKHPYTVLIQDRQKKQKLLGVDGSVLIESFQVSWLDRIKDFLVSNWQWLASAMLVPLASWGLSEWWKRRNPERKIGVVALGSTPDGADIFVNGSFVGHTPATLRLPTGNHTIRIVAGQREWGREISVLAGSKVKLSTNLEGQALGKRTDES